MKDINLEFFKNLVESHGVSGFEQEIQKIYRKFVSPYSDKIETDIHGNVYAIKNGKSDFKLMICGHADEVGLMVNYITDKGFVYFKAVGGIDPTILPGQRVEIFHRNQKIRGIIGRKAVHLISPTERNNAPKIADLWIDIGAKSKEDAEKKIAIGDYVTFSPGMEILNDDIIVSKSTDNKVGVYIAAMVLKELKDENIDINLFSVSAVQEEVGLRGSTTSAYNIKPDAAIIIDVTHATDYPGITKSKAGDISLGKGPAIAIGASINPRIYDILIETCEKNKIDFQIEPTPSRSGTDTDAIQISRGGVATGLLSIPNRYMHTPGEVISLKDVDDTVKLLVNFVKNLKADVNLIP